MALLSLSAAVGVSACGGTPPAAAPTGPPKTFCTDGKSVCKGNYVAECMGGGTTYKLTFCGEKTCEGGACKSTVCSKGQLTCNDTAVMQCPADGLTEATKIATCSATAKPAQKCADGTCLPSACFKGDATKPADAKCGNSTLHLCENGVWKTSTCASNQYCDSVSAACKDRACIPTSAQCKDEKAAQVCNSQGSAWVDQNCPAGEGCFDGVCRTIIASTTTGKDATSTPETVAGETSDSVTVGTGDTLVKPKKDIDPGIPDVFKVTFSKTKTPGAGDVELKMDFPAANYLATLKALQISGDKDLFKVEIQLGPIDEFQLGAFSQVGGEMGDTKIFVNDGSNDQTKVQWVWQAADYDIEITAFEDFDGRISGTFSAELVNAVDGKSKAFLTGGQFDIKRN